MSPQESKERESLPNFEEYSGHVWNSESNVSSLKPRVLTSDGWSDGRL